MTTPANTPQHRRVTILADDLTGATDSVVKFREAGWDAYLQLDAQAAFAAEAAGHRAVSFTLDTRALPDAEASRRTQAAVQAAMEQGINGIYLKIDSTMRGSVDAQVQGALAAWRKRRPDAIAVICPAYPAMGRTIEDGVLRVGGVSLEKTAAGTDPVTPVRSGALRDLIQQAVAIPNAASVQLLAKQLVQAAEQGSRIIVDAHTTEDLVRLAGAIAILGDRVIPVGSAGLAGQMAGTWMRDEAPSRPAHETASALGPGSIVVIVTSLNRVSREQADRLAQQLGDTISRHTFTQDTLMDRNQLAAWGRQHVPSLAPVVLLEPTHERIQSDQPASTAATIARGLAEVAAQFIDADKVAGLVLVGGDGAEATLARLGAQAIRIEQAVCEGVPMGRLVTPGAPPLMITTKAGGFGDVETLVRVVDIMLNSRKEKHAN